MIKEADNFYNLVDCNFRCKKICIYVYENNYVTNICQTTSDPNEMYVRQQNSDQNLKVCENSF